MEALRVIFMGKKFFAVLILLILVFSFGGCGEDSFTVSFSFQCESEIYAVRVEYYVGEDDVGGQTASLTPENNSAFGKGEEATFSFAAADFPKGAKIRDFHLELYLTFADGTEMLAASLGIVASYGNSYSYTIHGNREDGFRLQRG